MLRIGGMDDGFIFEKLILAFASIDLVLNRQHEAVGSRFDQYIDVFPFSLDTRIFKTGERKGQRPKGGALIADFGSPCRLSP